MPRPPSSAARFGTRFHAWVEARFGQQLLLDPDDLPGRADAGIDDDSDLQELINLFEAGPFATGCRTPSSRRSRWCSPARWCGAGSTRSTPRRVDGVDGADRYLLVDWKTNRSANADPLQLAIYRVAWAELHRRARRAGARGVLLRPQRRGRRARGPARTGPVSSGS